MAANAIANLLERDYQPPKLMSMAMQDNTLTAWMPKDEKGYGDTCVVKFIGTNSGGSGTTVAQAEASIVDVGGNTASFSWFLHYTSDSVSNVEALKLANTSGLADLYQTKIKSSMEKHGNVIETMLFGTGDGLLGQIATGGISGNVVTLTNASDAFNFEPGMRITFDDTITGASPRAITGEGPIVLSVDRGVSTATVTFDDLGNVTAEAAGDYLFLKSYVNAGIWPGLQQIIPATVPAAGVLFGGLDRGGGTVDIQTYCGWRYPVAAGQSIVNALTMGLTYGGMFGKGDTVIMSHQKFGELIAELGNKVIFDGFVDSKYAINIAGVKFMGAGRAVTVVPAVKCPNRLVYVLTRDTWKLRSVQSPLISVATQTGKYLDESSADSVKLRWRTLALPVCREPVRNGVIVFAS